MKTKITKITNTIGMAIIILTIIAFNLIIGGNQKELVVLPISIILGANIVALLIKKIVLKEKIVIKSKIDIAVLSFMMSLILPLLFKTYCTYQGTVEFILKYFFVYSIYLLIRNVIDTNKKANILIATTVFSSLIIIILGLDKMHNNYFLPIIEKLDLKYSGVDKFSSTFGYANTVAIYLLLCIYLAMNRIENGKSKILNIVYILYILIASYIIYITRSRLVLILYLFSIVVYLVVKQYKKIKNKKRILVTTIIGFIILITGFSIYVNIASKYSKPAPLETEKKIRKNFNPNEQYTLNLDLEVSNIQENDKETEIQVIQVNKYFQEKVLASIILKENENMQIMEFIPTESIYYLKLKVVNIGNKKIMIDKCYINDKEYVFKSKYMPSALYIFTQTLSLEDESILQRIQFYEACIKMTKGHLLIGQGGNAWKKLYYVYQKYPYHIKETHSYFFELLISYGIIGVTAFLAILIVLFASVIKEIIKDKEKRKQKLTILIGLGLLLLHSLTFDFNMSFIVIIITVFEYIAILQINNKQDIKTPKVVESITYDSILIALTVIFIISVKSSIAKNVIDYKQKEHLSSYVASYKLENISEKEIDNEISLKELKEFIKKEPYCSQNYIYKLYWNKLFEDIEKMNDKEFEEYVSFGIKTFKEIKCEKMMDYNVTLRRAKIMTDILSNLREINTESAKNATIELKEIIIKEYNENIINLQDCERNQMDEQKSMEVIKEYESYLENI